MIITHNDCTDDCVKLENGSLKIEFSPGKKVKIKDVEITLLDPGTLLVALSKLPKSRILALAAILMSFSVSAMTMFKGITIMPGERVLIGYDEKTKEDVFLDYDVGIRRVQLDSEKYLNTLNFFKLLKLKELDVEGIKFYYEGGNSIRNEFNQTIGEKTFILRESKKHQTILTKEGKMDIIVDKPICLIFKGECKICSEKGDFAICY